MDWLSNALNGSAFTLTGDGSGYPQRRVCFCPVFQQQRHGEHRLIAPPCHCRLILLRVEPQSASGRISFYFDSNHTLLRFEPQHATYVGRLAEDICRGTKTPFTHCFRPPIPPTNQPTNSPHGSPSLGRAGVGPPQFLCHPSLPLFLKIVWLKGTLRRIGLTDSRSGLDIYIPSGLKEMHRVVVTVGIRAHAVVFLAQRVHAVPAAEDRVVLACAVVVGVQAVHHVEFLSVVFKRLVIGIYCRRGVTDR